MTRLRDRRICQAFVQKLWHLFRLRRALYLLAGLGGITTLGWVLTTQVLMHPPQPQAPPVAVLSPNQQAQPAQAAETPSQGSAETSLQPQTTSTPTQQRETVSGAMATSTPHQTHSVHERSKTQERIPRGWDDPLSKEMRVAS